MKSNNSYEAKDIEVLEGLDPVRKRPGMYIGGTDDKAVHHLALEIIDNSMDEAIAGHADLIKISLLEHNLLKIEDNGRGIPIDNHPKFPGKSALEIIIGTLHAGGKFSVGAYKTSGGLHGVGISVVNVLSETLEVTVVRDKKIYTQNYSRGKAVSELKCIGNTTKKMELPLNLNLITKYLVTTFLSLLRNYLRNVSPKHFYYLELNWNGNVKKIY